MLSLRKRLAARLRPAGLRAAMARRSHHRNRQAPLACRVTIVTILAVTTYRASWLLLSYRLPSHPSRMRLAVWRRLKRSGAVLIEGGVWALPLGAQTQEHFEWLAEEIEEAGGRAFVWVAESLGTEQDQAMAARFRREAGNRYAVLLASARQLARVARLQRDRTPRFRRVLRQLGSLQRTLRLERRRDYFGGPGRRRLEEVLALVQRRLGVTRHREPRHGHALDHPASLPR